MKYIAIATALISVTTNALAVEWTTILTKPSYEILVDIDSYDMADGYPFILTKTVFKEAQPTLNKSTKQTYLYTIKNTQFNCQQPLFSVKSTKFFNHHHQLINQDKTPHKFSRIMQGSDEASVGQLVCQVHQMVGGQ